MGQGTSMGKGYTLVEIILTVVVLTILSAFTFSVIWQYSQLYADTRKGYIYGEASAVLERISRELRDAESVDTPGTSYINFSLSHGTPATRTGLTSPWVQYCTCSSGGSTLLYRIWNTSQGAGNQCQAGCPMGSNTSLMSRNITSSGFQVTCYAGNVTCGNPGPVGDSYGIELRLTTDQSANSQSVTLVSRVSPRNYTPYSPVDGTGMGSDRSFGGGYYDRIN
jgi:prepilin-type N-terminal cleavage/methylation domain-containing protein